MTIGIFIRMIFEHQFLILGLKLILSHSTLSLKNFIKVDLGIQSKLGEFDIDLLLVLQSAKQYTNYDQEIEDLLCITAFVLIGLKHLLQLLLFLLLLFSLRLLFLLLFVQLFLALQLFLPSNLLLYLPLFALFLQSALQLFSFLNSQYDFGLFLLRRILLVEQKMLLAEIELKDLLLRHLLLLFLIVLLQHSSPLGSGLCLIEFILFLKLALAFPRWHNIYINTGLNSQSDNLEEELWIQQLNFRLLDIDHSRWLRHHSLGGDMTPLSIGLGLLFIVLSNAVQKVHSGSRQFEMLDTNVYSFGNDTVTDLFVNNHSNCTRVDVEDSSSAAVVIFVGHALVDGAVDCDVHNIPDLV